MSYNNTVILIDHFANIPSAFLVCHSFLYMMCLSLPSPSPSPFSLSLCLSFSLSVSPSLSFCLSLYVSLCLYVCFSLSLSLFCICIVRSAKCMFGHIHAIYLSFSLFVSLSLSPSLSPSLSLTLHPDPYLCLMAVMNIGPWYQIFKQISSFRNYHSSIYSLPKLHSINLNLSWP